MKLEWTPGGGGPAGCIDIGNGRICPSILESNGYTSCIRMCSKEEAGEVTRGGSAAIKLANSARGRTSTDKHGVKIWG